MSAARSTTATPVVTVVNNHTITTSLNVAAVFGKPHNDVLKAIRSLDLPDEFRLGNFSQSSYLNAQGKEQPMFNLTRDGFTFLAFGFSGPKASKFKLAYIEAFNRMEEELLRQKAEAERPRIESAKGDPARLAESLMQAILAAISGQHEAKIDDLGVEVVSRLEDITGLLCDIPDGQELLPTLERLTGEVSGFKRQLVTMLPKLSVPDDLISDLGAVARRLSALADLQEQRDFAFHERLRMIEMRYQGIELDQTGRRIDQAKQGVMGYIEGNLPQTLRHKFSEMRCPKAAADAMLLQFMREVLVPDPAARIETNRLYAVYCAWSFSSMHTPMKMPSFKKMLSFFIPEFKGMSVRTEHYQGYLFGGRVRIPQESEVAVAVSAGQTEGRAAQ